MLGVKSELQLPAYATGTATQDLSCVCDLHHSSRQSQILNHLSVGRSNQQLQGVPVVVQWLTNPTRNHEVAGSVPALAQWVNDPALP